MRKHIVPDAFDQLLAPAPRLGEHSAAIAAEAGITEAEFARVVE